MATRRKKPGPPPIPKSERRSFYLTIPINAAERKALREKAGRAHLATWARGVLMQAK